MAMPVYAFNCVSNVFVKQITFLNAGDIERGHHHNFDHLTLLARGKLKVTALGRSQEFVAPHHIFIKAGVEHELEALEDMTVAHCIHAIRDGERVEDIIDPASVPLFSTALPDAALPLTQEELQGGAAV